MLASLVVLSALCGSFLTPVRAQPIVLRSSVKTSVQESTCAVEIKDPEMPRVWGGVEAADLEKPSECAVVALASPRLVEGGSHCRNQFQYSLCGELF